MFAHVKPKALFAYYCDRCGRVVIISVMNKIICKRDIFMEYNVVYAHFVYIGCKARISDKNIIKSNDARRNKTYIFYSLAQGNAMAIDAADKYNNGARRPQR